MGKNKQKGLAIRVCADYTQDSCDGSYEILAEIGEEITILGKSSSKGRTNCKNSDGVTFEAYDSWFCAGLKLTEFAIQCLEKLSLDDELTFGIVCETDLTSRWKVSQVREQLNRCVVLGLVSEEGRARWPAPYRLSPLGLAVKAKLTTCSVGGTEQV